MFIRKCRKAWEEKWKSPVISTLMIKSVLTFGHIMILLSQRRMYCNMWLRGYTLLRNLFSIIIKYFLKSSKAFYWLSRMPLYEMYNLFWQFPIFGHLDWINFLLLLKQGRSEYSWTEICLSSCLFLWKITWRGMTVSTAVLWRLLSAPASCLLEDAVTACLAAVLQDTIAAIFFLPFSTFFLNYRL